MSALLFAGLIDITNLAYFKFKLSEVWDFWIAHILTRPLVASIGDWPSQARSDGGLGLGTVTTSALFLLAIFVLVNLLEGSQGDDAWLSIHKDEKVYPQCGQEDLITYLYKAMSHELRLNIREVAQHF